MAFLYLLSIMKLRTLLYTINNIDYNTLKSSIDNTLDDKFIQVNSVEEMKETEKNHDNQFIFIIYGMIIILVIATLFILINTVSINIKNNEVSLSIMKLLGSTRRNLIIQNLIEGIIYGLFGAIVGEIFAVFLGRILTSSINDMLAWNIPFIIEVAPLIMLALTFIGISILAEIIATTLNYKNDFKVVLSQE